MKLRVRPIERILVSRATAAELLGVSVGTIDNLVADGTLPCVQLRGKGSSALFRVADLRALAGEER